MATSPTPVSTAISADGRVKVSVAGGAVVGVWEMKRDGDTLHVRQMPTPAARASASRGKPTEFTCDGSDPLTS